MPVLGLTGGIATGKSTFTHQLGALLSAEIFDADATVHALLASDLDVRAEILSAFGEAVMGADDRPDRAHLRDRIFADPEARARLEGILHPAVRRVWMDLVNQPRAAGAWLLVEIPLLYETGANEHFERIVVIGCSPATQRARLREKRNLDDLMLEKIIGAQGDLREKMRCANHVIWNDSTAACLEGQSRLIAGWLRTYYG